MITVNVTAHDINEGQRGDCNCCPVAIAVGRSIKGAEISIQDVDFSLCISVDCRVVRAPYAVRQFVRAFDDGGEGLRPFTFELPPVGDPEWKSVCEECGCLVDADTLDEGDMCESCAADALAEIE